MHNAGGEFPRIAARRSSVNRALTCSCLYWFMSLLGGLQSYLYADRVGFFVA
jgi:lipid-A-disaccharide synthase-like uncharacterized protein